METGRRGLIIKWLAGLCGMLFIGGGNMLGVLAHALAAGNGMIRESADMLRWLVTGGLWLIGLVLTAAVYALGTAAERIDRLEARLAALDTAFRNQTRE